ncbi:MAG: M20/M25/M40 family metallo-hydrolase [Candidatus Helarchaeota archaeon]
MEIHIEGILLMENNFLKKLIAIESISGNEKEIIKFIKNFLEKNEIKTKIDSVGNVIAEIGSGSETLILSSHVDTVPGKIQVLEKDGMIFGRGAVDDKGTTAAMILSLLEFKKIKLKKKIKYIGIVEEETSLRGMKPFIKNKLKADAAIFGEPTNNKIAIAYKGRLHYDISLINLEGTKHPANMNDDNNPILLVYYLWNEIDKIFKEKFKGKTPFFSVIPNITVIKTQNNSNVIPAKCDFSIDIRIPPGISLETIKDQLIKIFKEFQENFPIKIKFKIVSEIPGYRIDKNEKIVKIAKKAVDNAFGTKQKFIRKTGTNFMNVFGGVLSIPTISIGPGNPKLEHTVDEHIEVQEFMQAIKIYKNIIELFLSL